MKRKIYRVTDHVECRIHSTQALPNTEMEKIKRQMLFPLRKKSTGDFSALTRFRTMALVADLIDNDVMKKKAYLIED